ncbi:MAG TPA: amidohydrolase family protein [Xanthobacteraceae bacterium]|nr:amidohydrolase family protein [Xanthobacteraceae bacterium]
MNIQVAPRVERANKLGLVDVDIHPRPRSVEELKPFLTQQWWDYLQTYGFRRRHGFWKGHPYPKSQPSDGMRRDAYPPEGGPPGSSLSFMQAQHLDPYGVDYGILNPLSPTGQGDLNSEFSRAVAFASNEWQLDTWIRNDKRLKASIVVPYEDPQAAVAEIRKRAGNKDFAHVLLMSRTAEALGRRKYWPIYEAAVEAGLPVGIHVFGFAGYASTNAGWGSYYIEEMTEHAASCAALATSMIVEGLFEHLPDLRIVLIESGFGWVPSLGWRLDKHWKKMKDEVPHLKRAPSEYLRSNFWFSTQPMEESERPEHVKDLMGWIGWDRILFASDYPHWDYDDPLFAIPPSFGEERRKQIFFENAKALYGFD